METSQSNNSEEATASSTEEAGPRALENTGEKEGEKPTNKKAPARQIQEGRNYEGYIAMLFIMRAVFSKFIFKIGVEIEPARKFDDLVFLREEGEKQTSRCLQAKHNATGKKKIDSMSLLTGDDSDFSIIKYFFAYKDMVGDDYFKGIEQEDLIVYTNIPLDMESSIGPKMILTDQLMTFDPIDVNSKPKKLKDLFERVTDQDSILDVTKEESCRYKFNDKLIHILLCKANEYNVTRLAQALKDWITGQKSLQQVEDVIRPYWKFLTEEIIDVDQKKFYGGFLKLNKKVASKEAQLFHKKITEECVRKNKQNQKKDDNFKTDDISVEYLNQRMGEISEYPIWELPLKDVKMNSVIKVEEIQAFFGLFVFAVNQPDQSELKEIIKQDILQEHKRKYGDDDFHKEDIDRYVDDILQYFHSEVFNWTGEEVVRIKKKEKEIKYKTFENSHQLLEWKAVKFNVQNPVKSFMGRDKEIEDLSSKIRMGKIKNEHTNVICGLPGMGKSELVRGYIQKYHRQHENIIIWIDAGSRESMEDSFRRLAEILNKTTKQPDETLENIDKVVEHVYREFYPKKCLFVFDDACNMDSIDPFMPKESDFGTKLPFVIITTATSDWKFKTDLTVLSPENAKKLVENQISVKDKLDTDRVKLLVQMLEFFPLAIQQVAVYIEKKLEENSEYTVSKCIDEFNESSGVILKMELPEEISSYKKNTFTNFRNILQSILNYENIGKKAIEVINVISFLATKDIKTEWLESFFKVKLEEEFGILIEYSIIKIESGNITIHSLVQLVTRLMMKEQNLEETFIEKTIEFMEHVHPKKYSMSDFHTKRELTFHLEAFILCVDEIYASGSDDNHTFYIEEILWTLGNCYSVTQNHKKGKEVYERLESIVRHKYGKDDVKTINARMNLATAERNLGNYAIAKSHYDEVFAALKKIYGEDHVQTVKARMNLANAERNLGNYAIAKSHYDEVFAALKKIYGEDHAETVKARMNLANAERNLGNYAIAKSHYDEVFAALKKIYGEDHAETVTARMNLANAERNLGNYAIAKSHYDEVFAALKKIYGEDHAETVTARMNLANAERNLGNYAIAKSHYDEVFAALKKIYGEDHAETVKARMNLANAERNLGNYAIAKSHYDEVFATRKKIYGEDHVETVTARMGLANAESDLGNYAIAKSHYDEVFAARKKIYGEDHVETVSARNNLAVAEGFLGNYAIAKSHYDEVFAALKKIYGEDHVKTVTARMNLATAESDLGNYAIAKSHYDEVFAALKKIYGEDHVETVTARMGLATAESDLGNYAIAKSHYDEVFAALKKIYGEDHVETVTARMNLAIAERNLGNYAIAKSHYDEVFAARKKIYGEDHVQTVTARMNLANAESDLGNYAIAKSHYDEVFAARKKIYGEDHVATATVIYNMGCLEQSLKNYTAAKMYYEKALKVYVEFYGEQHERTVNIHKKFKSTCHLFCRHGGPHFPVMKYIINARILSSKLDLIICT
ncbi:uncharacterized protein LOC143917873 [Arctopsyche grandis]|uniref:uncharacterized protein LOC143917873 n=1 Tax=Arctopsyche grandis TaxID=121162 RepID=UPI00406D6E41